MPHRDMVEANRRYSQNAKWPFGLSHNRLQTGGWARQQNGSCPDPSRRGCRVSDVHDDVLTTVTVEVMPIAQCELYVDYT